MGFIRNNGGIAESVLESNRINVSSNWGTGQVNTLRDNVPLVQNVASNQFGKQNQVSQSTFFPLQQSGYSQSVLRNGPVNFVYSNPVSSSNLIGQGSTIIPPNYGTRFGEPISTGKY